MDKEEVAKDRSLQFLAGEYADLLSIAQDLVFTSSAARRFSALTDDDSDGVLRRSLWGASVVAYRRCFTTGRGHGLIQRPRLKVPHTAIDALSPGMREIHDLALKEANTHVAHRVDDEMDQMPISLLFRENESGEDEVVGVSVFGATKIGGLPDQVAMLGVLADQLRNAIEEMAAEKQRIILARASTLLGE